VGITLNGAHGSPSEQVPAENASTSAREKSQLIHQSSRSWSRLLLSWIQRFAERARTFRRFRAWRFMAATLTWRCLSFGRQGRLATPPANRMASCTHGSAIAPNMAAAIHHCRVLLIRFMAP